MSNASIVERIRGLIADYQSHTISPEEFESAIEFHIEALEYVDLEVVHKARNLCWELVNAHYIDGDEKFGNPDDLATVVNRFHKFLSSLPTAPT